MISQLESSGAIVPCGAPGSVATGLLFSIPDADGEFFATRVQHDEQKRVRDVLVALEEIYSVRNTEGVVPACKRLANSLDRHWRSLRRDYYAYSSTGCHKGGEFYPAGDWRTVLNFSKVRTERANLPFATLELWRELGELNQRVWTAAYDELLQIVRTGYGYTHGANAKPKHYKVFPGYKEWPVIPPGMKHPPGMSYNNLMNHKSDVYDQALMRVGRAKAADHRLPVLKSRVGVAFGSVLIFDDHDFNQKVLFQTKPMRPMGFGCVEYLSGCMVKLGLKPMLWDEEANRKLVLTEREFLWFFLATISDVGFNASGCRFDLENAKATIREPWLSRLKAILGEKFVFNFGSRPANHTRGVAGQFAGQPKGNPRTKALLESFWNPLDNQTAGLAGQIGNGRDNAPAQLYGAEQYTAQLMRQAEAKGVPMEALQFPFDLFPNWAVQAHEAVNRINAGTDHDLEGWEKCGFVKLQWRANPESPLWLEQAEFEALDEVTRAIVRRRLDHNAALVRKEVLSRVQVANGFRDTLKKFPLHHWPEVLGREFALVNTKTGSVLHEVGKQKAGLFSFDCEQIDSDTLHFYAYDERDNHGYIPNGKRFVCFLNLFLPHKLVVCDESLRVVAICPRYDRATNEASLHQALGQQKRYEAAAEVRLNLRHDDKATRDMKRHNAEVLETPKPPMPTGPVEEFDHEARAARLAALQAPQ